MFYAFPDKLYITATRCAIKRHYTAGRIVKDEKMTYTILFTSSNRGKDFKWENIASET